MIFTLKVCIYKKKRKAANSQIEELEVVNFQTARRRLDLLIKIVGQDSESISKLQKFILAHSPLGAF